MPRKVVETVFDTFDSKIKNVEREVEVLVEPARKTVFKRFPVLFTLLSTFGVVCVLFGFERLITEISFFNEQPFLILLLGISILVLTGTLYKKL